MSWRTHHGWPESESFDVPFATSEMAGWAFEKAGDVPGEVASPDASAVASTLYSLATSMESGAKRKSDYLNELPDFALSSLSFSFFSFCAGGVLTRLEAPESCALDKLRGFRELDPLALANIDVGPNCGPAVLV